MKSLLKHLSLRYIDVEIDRGLIVITPEDKLTLMDRKGIDMFCMQFREIVVMYQLSSALITRKIINHIRQELYDE